ncbi:putative histone deacetylase HOS2 [Cyphellophora attinorum]|uniref:Histone deacetylase n=1 Tax=Cyphellophora attinorum TaxID=1664694 RepID=A0A0N0NL23_9EURO|nr:putative histone deacetylase HOS2 [Phialophora attinorum]KPI38801.1 putative histone deacetylase HOS2 [Phialophora attinorum]
MARGSIVQEYDESRAATFYYSRKIEKEAEENQIARPKGYTVSWHSNPDVEDHHFGQTHPMKPWRLTLTKELVMSYGMHLAMDLYLSRAATQEELKAFHKDEYIDFLHEPGYSSAVYGVGDDCPIFDGLYDYCSLYAGASIDAARKLCSKQSDIAINWSGGLHHAKKGEASGFCYVNDIVLAILQLLRVHARVLYIDIDVHHGDGVEQAFWSSDRVMCVSFHKYDREVFFPGTGPLESTGPIHPNNPGKNYTINVPLNDGIDDSSYQHLFETIIGDTIDVYRPDAIVLQCGADSLGHDRLGCFNLNIKGHGQCVTFVKSFRIPLLVVGGGGYTPRNVARAWAHETSICIGADKTLNPALPEFMPLREAFRKEGFTLFPNLGSWRKDNLNDQKYIQKIIEHVKEQLRYIKHAPSVQMQEIPPDIQGWREECQSRLNESKREQQEKVEEREGAGSLATQASVRRVQEKSGLPILSGNVAVK